VGAFRVLGLFRANHGAVAGVAVIAATALAAFADLVAPHSLR
jgi:hypothetical protein